jgi:hypothetical protein
MKLNDKVTLDIAATVKDVVEGKVKKEEAKYPHDMFHPETGEKKVAKDEKDHKELSKKGYTHDKPKNESPEEPRAKGEKDFKALHKVKSSGEKDMDGTVVKETKHEEEESQEEAKLSEEEKYKLFFAKALKKFGAESPAELDKEKRKEFFNYVDKNYKAKNEDVQEDVRDMKNYKDRDRKGHEAYMFIHVIKGNSSNKFNDDFGFTKAEMDQMDKLISKIKKMHVASFDGGSSAPASLEFYGDEASLTKFLADRNVQKIVKKYKAKVNGPTSNK